eukprot:221309_1
MVEEENKSWSRESNNEIEYVIVYQDENKYDPNTTKLRSETIQHHNATLKLKVNPNGIASRYVEPREDDYIQCNHDILKCNAAIRVVHLLECYKKTNHYNHQHGARAMVDVDEYISSLQGYNVSKFMEDWYHCKTMHFKTETDAKWFAQKNEIRCDQNDSQNECYFAKRYMRDRTQAMYAIHATVDHKNVILMDQLDQIHVFIFHFASQRRYRPRRRYDGTNDAKSTEDTDGIWINDPQSIEECNVQQIVYILNHSDIFSELDRLRDIKHDIIQYLEQNQYDGAKWINTTRKDFMNQIADHMNQKKIKGQLTKLYLKIAKYDLKKSHLVHRDGDNSTSVSGNENTDNAHDIEEVKGYVDGDTFETDQTFLNKTHNKFVTHLAEKNDESKVSNYAFGVQYKYTKNFTEHPLYVAPKYKDIKDELYEYLKKTNQRRDEDMLLQSQLDVIDSMAPHVQAMLTRFVSEDTMHNQIDLTPLWINETDTDDGNETIIDLFKVQSINWVQVISIIDALCLYSHSLSAEIQNQFDNVVQFIFRKLLDRDITQYYGDELSTIRGDIRRINKKELHGLIKTIVAIYEAKQEMEFAAQYAAHNDNKEAGRKLKEQKEQQNQKQTHFEQVFSVIMEIFSKDLQRFMINELLIYQTKLNNKNKEITVGAISDILFNIISKYYKQKYYAKHHKKWQHSFKIVAQKWSQNERFVPTFWKELTPHDNESHNEITPHNALNTFYGKFDVFQSRIHKMFKINADELQEVFWNSNSQQENETLTALREQFIEFSKLSLRQAFYKNKIEYVRFQTTHRFQQFIEKAKMRITMDSVKRMSATRYFSANEPHQILPNDPLFLRHIVALICYSDNTDLCTSFRMTYRLADGWQNKLARGWTEKEDDYGKVYYEALDKSNANGKPVRRRVRPTMAKEEQLTHQHAVFANIGRLLYEAFVFYASKDNQIMILYHGMSIKLSFPTLHCFFDAPTSTTSDSSVAQRFCDGNGIVLKFESSESSKYIRTLDMGLFSCFEESEHLIFETRLHIKDIAIPSEASWIGDDWIKTLSLYDLLIHGGTVHNRELLKKKIQKRLCKLLQRIIDNKLSTYASSPYLQTLIISLTRDKKKIWLNPQQINELDEKLKQMFVDSTGSLGTFIVYLKTNYDVVIGPIFMTKWKINDHTLDLITRTEKHKNIIISGQNVSCNLSDEKTIIFRPQITKVQDLFDVQMQVMSVYDNCPIKVHFNMDCHELDGYYTSSHPRLMNTNKYDKYYDITLPNIVQKTKEINSISLGMSIMIHNFEMFGIDYKDFASANLKVMVQDMVHTKKSYTFPDCLSWFYGISNSVISILDSASDIAFIIFLSYYTEARQYQDIDQFETEQRASQFLLVLSIGDLIAVAIVIGLYLSYSQSNQPESYRTRFLHFCFFVALSPVLPAFEWLLQRLKVDREDFLIVSPHHDGILLWFQQELIRNKIFLIESVFESCFQIIVQFMAVFVLEGLIFKDIYLYSSIVISLLVILSKFILLTYNLQRMQMFLNVLCYFMDIFFSLIFGIFIASFLLQNIFSCTALYIIFEFLIYIPCYTRILLSSSVSYLSIPLLPILYYPVSIFSLSAFSMYAIVKHFMTRSMKIGQHEELYQALYVYCCRSPHQSDFNKKLMIINYVALHSYFDSLKQDDDPNYYQFAQWFLQQNPRALSYTETLQSFYSKCNNTGFYKLIEGISKHGTDRLQSCVPYLVVTKSIQLLMRVMFIPICVVLDITTVQLFTSDSSFIHHYKNTIASFGIIGIILFFVWIGFVVFELRYSKWNSFCFGMVTPTHKNFALITTPTEFVKTCDAILKNESNVVSTMVEIVNTKHLETIWSYELIGNHLNSNKYNEPGPDQMYLVQLIGTGIMSIIVIIVTSVAKQRDYDNNCYKRSHDTHIWVVVTMSMALLISIIGIYVYRFQNNVIKDMNIKLIINGFLFSFSLSGIVVYLYMSRFHEHEPCQSNDLWILVIVFLFIIAEFTLTMKLMMIIGHYVYQCCCIRKKKKAETDLTAPDGRHIDENGDESYKLVVLGGGGTGKSALTIRLVTDNFLDDYDPSIEDSYRKMVIIDGQRCHLDVLDTAGQEEFSSMQDQWMREAQAYLLVYSITSQPTFEETWNLREKIIRTKEDENPVIVLVGNHCHLEHERKVQKEEGQKLVEEWGKYVAFYEASAKEKINVEDCFYQAVRLIWQKREDWNKYSKEKDKKSIF